MIRNCWRRSSSVVQACLQDGLLRGLPRPFGRWPVHDARGDGVRGPLRTRLDITALGADAVAALFSEELGAVLQVRARRRWPTVLHAVRRRRASVRMTHRIGRAVAGTAIRILHGGTECYRASRVDLHRAWAELSFTMQGLRDNPACAREEYDALLDADDPGPVGVAHLRRRPTMWLRRS